MEYNSWELDNKTNHIHEEVSKSGVIDKLLSPQSLVDNSVKIYCSIITFLQLEDCSQSFSGRNFCRKRLQL